jgi:hypothetical protein
LSIVNKRLSKEALDSIEAFKSMIHGAGKVEVNAIEESRGGVWGASLKFFNKDNELVSMETYLTTRHATRRVAAFIVLIENGNAIDEEWQPLFMPGSSKTLSDFISMLLDEDIAPSPLTMSAAGYEATDTCEISGDEDYPCSECDPDEGECDECACAECEEECDDAKRQKCEGNPFEEE